MSQGYELNTAISWIRNRLLSDNDLVALVGDKIYEAPVPFKLADDTNYILITYLSGVDYYVIGGHRLWTRTQWIVRGVRVSASFGGDVAAMAARIDAVLHNSSGQVNTGDVIACTRVNPYRTTVNDNGRTIKHLGGIYLLLPQ